VKCKTTLRLIRKWLQVPILINGKLHKRYKVLPQGSPLSPLLSNIMLDQLDKYLEKRWLNLSATQTILASISDQSRKQNLLAMKSMFIWEIVYVYLRDKLELKINRHKSGIRRPSNLTILAHSFTSVYKKGSKGQYQLIGSKNSWENLKRKLKRVTKKTLAYSFHDRLIAFKLTYQRWIKNYRLANIYSKLKMVDERLRNRLRYCIWHDWKKPNRKHKNLIRLRVEKGILFSQVKPFKMT